MCVIINKDPGIELPFAKIQSACHVNSDGWGMSVIDRGKMETIKDYDSRGNDPDTIAKFLETAKDQRVFLHLRFVTAGAKDKDNCHPFESLDYKKHGFGVNFMHNGTVYAFKEQNNDRSDSFMINQKLVAPMVEAFFHKCGEDVLTDPTLQMVLKNYCNSSSCFTLYDSKGNWLVIDEKKQGKQFEGYWASNEYSFDSMHRTPKATNQGSYRGGNGSYTSHWSEGYDADSEWVHTESGAWARLDSQLGIEAKAKEDAKGGSVVPFVANVNKEVKAASSPAKDAGTDEASIQCKLVGVAVNEVKKKGLSMAEHTPPAKRVSFVDLAELNLLEDVCVLTEEEIEDLVKEQPVAAAILIMDLIHEMYAQTSVKMNRKVN
jgi:predicted glutamine amidotransferase